MLQTWKSFFVVLEADGELQLTGSETYVKVKGKWTYLYQAIDKLGNTIDFYLSSTRNKKAAKRFTGKALKSIKSWAHPKTINSNKVPPFGSAINEMQEEGKFLRHTIYRRVRPYRIDHRKLKRLINPVRGFKSMQTA